jgi:hypothetical protein
MNNRTEMVLVDDLRSEWAAQGQSYDHHELQQLYATPTYLEIDSVEITFNIVTV